MAGGIDPALLARIRAIRSGTAPAPATSAPGAPAPGNRARTAGKPLTSAGPFAALAPIIEGEREVKQAGASAFGKALDLLSRPGRAFEHFYASPDAAHPDFGGAANVFMHGNTQAQQDADRASIRHQLHADNAYANAPHWAQGIGDFVIDTATDPTTFIGGSGLLEGAGRTASAKILPRVLGAAAKTSRAASRADAAVQAGAKALAPRLPQVVRKPVEHIATQGTGAPEALNSVGDMIAGIYDAVGPHNRLGRQAVQRYGTGGRDIAQEIVMARNASRALRSQLNTQLSDDFGKAIKGLSPEEERQVYAALDKGVESKLPPKLQGPAQRISQLTDTIAWLQGTKGLQKQLAQNGFALGDEYKAFEGAMPRRVQTAAQYRKNYIPKAHDQSGWIDDEEQYLGGKLRKQQAQRRARYADQYDPNLLPRADEPAAQALDPDLQRELFKNRFSAAARSIAGRDTQVRAAAAVGAKAKNLPGFVNEYLQPIFKAPEDRHAFVRLLDTLYRGTVDIPKQALFALPFRHMLNITTLMGLHDPGAAAEAVKLFFQQYTKGGIKSEAERRALLKDAYEGGVLSAGSLDRQRPWTQRLWGVGNLYGSSSNALWAYDDAVKAAVYRRALRRGFSPQEASRETLNALIDYSNRSDLTNLASYAAPFATYRTKLPGAIARATGKHPERVLALGRSAPALTGGQQPSQYVDQQGTQMVSRGYTPVSDIYGAVDDPWSFARTSMSWPAQLSASAVNWNPPGKEPHYFTYGYPRDEADRSANWTPASMARYIGNQFPYVQNVLEKEGFGIFPDRGFVRPIVEGQTGVRLTYPKRDSSARSTDPTAMRLRSVEASFRRPMSQLKKSGDDEGAALLDQIEQATIAGNAQQAKQLQAQFQQHRLARIRAILASPSPGP